MLRCQRTLLELPDTRSPPGITSDAEGEHPCSSSESSSPPRSFPVSSGVAVRDSSADSSSRAVRELRSGHGGHHVQFASAVVRRLRRVGAVRPRAQRDGARPRPVMNGAQGDEEPGEAPTKPAAPDPLSHERLRTRGYIADFGRGRTCSTPGCRTLLSRYNSGRLCWVHDDRSRAVVDPKGS